MADKTYWVVNWATLVTTTDTDPLKAVRYALDQLELAMKHRQGIQVLTVTNDTTGEVHRFDLASDDFVTGR